MTERRLGPLDLWVSLLALALVVASWVSLGDAGEGGAVWVRQDGTLVARLDLDRPTRLPVTGPLGTTWVEVAQGQVRFLSSPCSGQQCVLSGWLRDGGAFAACLPNGVSLRVVAREPRYDSINF